ncbi:cation:proton antiporter [Catenuloplanes indicus]|uniref:CPA1 family monovalent cation:H+ antiporter n=1 Tax=Catenuloplanes indicus TaxID=137267 RepID=A0AAE3WA36_9ACTN|nr:sodium:proton antiporter [Catenuloplanes indicus]MDQ0371245.1 CPA1 family monovalent cation:H+ antiporter [Catenuloplanes indicus]
MNGVQLLLIAGAGIAVAAVARRKGLEPGMFVVVLAAAASFLPGMPRLELESEVILAIVVPPLLYSAARGASFAGFRRNLRPIISLGVLLVVLTAGALGLIAGWLLPSIGAAAFVLGAVLAPPDTITTVSHGEEIGLPERATSVLTGESLVNDATALTLFSIAIAAVDGAHTTVGAGVAEFFRSAFLGVGIGALLATATLLIRRWLRDATLETALVLLLPFTAFLAAEAAHVSGILAVVMASFLVSVNLRLDPNHEYPGAYRTRVRENEVWPVLDFLLETFVFAYIGLQLRFVLEDLVSAGEPGLGRTLLAAGVLLAAAIVIRIAGVYALFGRWMLRARMTARRRERDPVFRAARERWIARGGLPPDPPTQRETLLAGWTGMRGILTLAAAAAIPETTSSGVPFPGRDEIQAIALFVTLGTLIIQGTTIGALARLLRFDLAGERAAREQMRAAGRALLAGRDFQEQRAAVRTAVRDRTLSEEVARELIDDIDLRQAASSDPM